MDKLQIAYKIVFFLILFFSSLLAYFLLFLIYSHFRTSFVNSKKLKMKAMLSNYLKGVEIKSLSAKKLFRTIGMEAISEFLENAAEEDKLKLRDWLIKHNFDNYIRKKLKASNKNAHAYIIKLIGNLMLVNLKELIEEEIYDNKDSMHIQLVGFEALAKLGCGEELMNILNDETMHIHLTYRAFQSIFTMYNGDKIPFYKKMLNVRDEYVVRVIIKAIGNERIYELVQDIGRFINSDNKDMKIAVISSLGQLKDKESYEAIRSLCKDDAWEVRSAAIKSIAQIDLEASVDCLMEGLSDKEWWVRYNSASALVHCKAINEIYEEVAASEDRFAKEIFSNAIEKMKL